MSGHDRVLDGHLDGYCGGAVVGGSFGQLGLSSLEWSLFCFDLRVWGSLPARSMAVGRCVERCIWSLLVCCGETRGRGELVHA
jgi:hypothetical protein